MWLKTVNVREWVVVTNKTQQTPGGSEIAPYRVLAERTIPHFVVETNRLIRQVRDKLSDQERALREELQRATHAREGFQQVNQRRFIFQGGQ